MIDTEFESLLLERSRLLARLEELSSLREGWDGEVGVAPAPAPSPIALRHAQDVLFAAMLEDVNILEVDPDVLGGVAVWLSCPRGHADGCATRWAWVDCRNSGTVGIVEVVSSSDGLHAVRTLNINHIREEIAQLAVSLHRPV